MSIRDLVRSGTLEVEHDHVNPDDIPGYWTELAIEHGTVTRESAEANGLIPTRGVAA